MQQMGGSMLPLSLWSPHITAEYSPLLQAADCFSEDADLAGLLWTLQMPTSCCLHGEQSSPRAEATFMSVVWGRSEVHINTFW